MKGLLDDVEANPSMLDDQSMRDLIEEYLRDLSKSHAFSFYTKMLANFHLEHYHDVQVWLVEQLTKIEIWSTNSIIRPETDFYTTNPSLYRDRLSWYQLLK